MNNNLIREALRKQTQDAHKRAETARGMKILMSPSLTAQDYLGILTTWLNWHYKNEPFIFAALEDFAPADINKRTKIPLLETDLKHANIPVEAKNLATPKLTLQNKYQALGALYVLEGSTLGGQIILKQLRQKLDSRLPHYFYTGYGEATYQQWHIFLAHLATCPLNTLQRQQVIDGANKTFDSIYLCLNQFESFEA